MTDRHCYDGIVLGTGHNALILQAYLCRCGLKILSVDRADVPGGGLTTVENPRLPGCQHNTHSFFHRALTAMPWYRDLELARHGAEYVEPDLNVAMILNDNRSLQWWTNFERTCESFAQFSPADARSLRRWRDDFQPVVEKILRPEAQSPPLSPDLRRRWLDQSPEGRLLQSVSQLSPLEFVKSEFENDIVRAGLLFFNGLREVDLRLKGFGHSIPALLASDHMAQMCLGGSARLADAIVSDIEEHGGEVLLNASLASILVRDCRAIGIELSDGTRIHADGFVASGLNPQQTFCELMHADATPSGIRDQANGFQYNLLAPLFTLNLALTEPPRYAAAEKSPELNDAFMVILGLERFDQFERIVAAHENGKIPETVMWGACPTNFDSTQAPLGMHTAFMWEKLPYRINGNPENWDRLVNEHARKLLQHWQGFAPNLTDDVVLDSFARSPLDTERTLPNMYQGDLLIGSFANDQVGFHRPFPGAGEYRTPVPGLYLCGGSTHPGGNITGLCGYNAARVIAADLKLKHWWDVPEVPVG